jgi:hypothetical protein
MPFGAFNYDLLLRLIGVTLVQTTEVPSLSKEEKEPLEWFNLLND